MACDIYESGGCLQDQRASFLCIFRTILQFVVLLSPLISLVFWMYLIVGLVISGVMMILTLRQEVPSDTTTGQVGMIRKGQLTLFLAWAWCGLRYLRKWWLFAGSACLVPLYLPHHLAVCRSVVTSYLFCLLNGLDCKISGLMMILTLRQEVPSDTTTGQVGMIRKGQLTLFFSLSMVWLAISTKVVVVCRISVPRSFVSSAPSCSLSFCCHLLSLLSFEWTWL